MHDFKISFIRQFILACAGQQDIWQRSGTSYNVLFAALETDGQEGMFLLFFPPVLVILC